MTAWETVSRYLGWGIAVCITLMILGVVRYGWGFLLPFLHRGETAEVPEEFDTQPRTGDRDEWDSRTADAVLLTHEKRGDEESDESVADFVLWKFELDEEPSIRKHMRRMDRWSR